MICLVLMSRSDDADMRRLEYHTLAQFPADICIEVSSSDLANFPDQIEFQQLRCISRWFKNLQKPRLIPATRSCQIKPVSAVPPSVRFEQMIKYYGEPIQF